MTRCALGNARYATAYATAYKTRHSALLIPCAHLELTQ